MFMFFSNNSIFMLKFLGDVYEDVNEFLINFNWIVVFYYLNLERMVEVLLLFFIGSVSIWFNIIFELKGRGFDIFLEVFKK